MLLKISEIYVRYQSLLKKKKNLLWAVMLIDSRKKQCCVSFSRTWREKKKGILFHHKGVMGEHYEVLLPQEKFLVVVLLSHKCCLVLEVEQRRINLNGCKALLQNQGSNLMAEFDSK